MPADPVNSDRLPSPQAPPRRFVEFACSEEADDLRVGIVRGWTDLRLYNGCRVGCFAPDRAALVLAPSPPPKAPPTIFFATHDLRGTGEPSCDAGARANDSDCATTDAEGSVREVNPGGGPSSKWLFHFDACGFHETRGGISLVAVTEKRKCMRFE